MTGTGSGPKGFAYLGLRLPQSTVMRVGKRLVVRTTTETRPRFNNPPDRKGEPAHSAAGRSTAPGEHLQETGGRRRKIGMPLPTSYEPIARPSAAHAERQSSMLVAGGKAQPRRLLTPSRSAATRNIAAARTTGAHVLASGATVSSSTGCSDPGIGLVGRHFPVLRSGHQTSLNVRNVDLERDRSRSAARWRLPPSLVGSGEFQARR